MRPGLLRLGPSHALGTVFCAAVWGQKLVAASCQVGAPLCQVHAEVGTWDLGCPLVWERAPVRQTLAWAGSLLCQLLSHVHVLPSAGMELEIQTTSKLQKSNPIKNRIGTATVNVGPCDFRLNFLARRCGPHASFKGANQVLPCRRTLQKSNTKNSFFKKFQ